MSTFSINPDGNILEVGFSGSEATSPDIVRDTVSRLQVLVESGQLSGGPFIGVTGACSLLSAYALSHVLSSLYSTVAVYDPKLNGYVVVKSSTTGYQVGEVVVLESGQDSKALKIIICGPLQVGKSCLREGLKQALMAHYRKQDCAYPYVLTACPDGEGAWFSKTAQQDPVLAQRLKAEYRAQFTPAFATLMAEAVQKLTVPLTLIDMGGQPSPENHRIASGATHAIILWRERLKPPKDDLYYSSLEQWQQFCDDEGLEIIAEVKSEQRSGSGKVLHYSPMLKGTIHTLKRGQDCSAAPVIQALAQTIIDF